MNEPERELWVAKSFHFSSRPLPCSEHLINYDDAYIMVMMMIVHLSFLADELARQHLADPHFDHCAEQKLTFNREI